MNYELSPEGLRGEMQRYIEHGIRPGSFLMACLVNRFAEAVILADEENLARIRDIAQFLHNEVPMSLWGDARRVTNWIAKHDNERALEEVSKYPSGTLVLDEETGDAA